MSIDDRFKTKPATVSAKSLDSLGKNAESADNVIATRKRVNAFLPPIDYSSASNFAVYGSAEKYYEDAVKRIYLEYPYDGSEKEINEYILSSSFLDQYVLNKRYPRTCGHLSFKGKNGWGSVADSSGDYGAVASASYQYVTFFGGPNTRLSTSDPIHHAFSGSHNQNNIYDLSKKRGSNLALNPTSGSTVEFWLRKETFAPDKTKKEVILDVWNGNTTYTDASYGRFMVEMSASANSDAGQNVFRITYLSGTTGITNQPIGLPSVTTSSVANNLWNHYAITLASSSDSGLNGKLFINGELNDSKFFSSVGTLQEIGGPIHANLGALIYTPPGSNDAPQKGWGTLTASIDEFRYWKTERTAEEVGRNWFTQVRGGTNTDDANVDLGVYFKFNEGITTDTSIDSTILDYSGRVSNGTFTGYGTINRGTGSAIESSHAAPVEFRDPIVHPSHPDVSRILGILKDQGRIYDQENNSSIFNSLPAWIIENDSSGHLKNLVQIVASYFDRLQNQIREVPRLKNLTYLSSSYNSPGFSSDLVNSTGMFASEMFIDSSILEQILSRDEDRNFELDLDEIRNRIYQNIYNNLVYINKAKGTEKAFRNLIHCYGIDEELIRLNTYGNEVTYKLRDNFRSTVIAKNLIDFSDETRNAATVYQMTSSTNVNSVSFISGSASESLNHIGDQVEDYLGLTLESEVIFPVTPDICESTSSIGSAIISSSIYGMHGARGGSPADTTWPDTDYADLRVLSIRSGQDVNSEDASFILTSSIGGMPTLTTDVFKNVYGNNKWNFAVRVINEKYPLGDVIQGVSGSSEDYRLEFYGVSQTLDVIQDEFFITGSIGNLDAIRLLRSDKRIFAGAHRTNFTGSTLQKSDVKLSGVKYWSNYIDNEIIRAHSRDTDNYGTLFPHRNAFLTSKSVSGSYIPEIETLALNWGFYNLTGSDSQGSFIVDDNSSGSVELQNRYGWLGKIVKAQHTAIGHGFPADDKKAISKEFIYTAKQVQPEIVQSSEMINVLDRDDENFTRDQRPINYFFSIEKSMYQVISDEMLNTFATIVEFNNLIGDPVNRYRQDYKLLGKARSLYFEDIENNPDLDKFIDFYKWIDSSLSIFLQQLIPASANSSKDIRTLIESHVLERNKYWSKFPTLERKVPGGPQGLVTAGTSMGGGTSASPYRSRDGANAVLDSAPIPYVQSKHAPYWKKKASRLEAPLATGISGVDNDRQAILEALQSGYLRDTNRPLVINDKLTRSIHGGTNFPKSKDRQIVLNATYPDGPRAASGTPLNIVLIDDTEVKDFQNIDDVVDPNEKKFYSFNCRIRREDETGILNKNNDTYTSVIKGNIAAPFRLVSGSVTSGYNILVTEGFKSGTILTNLHEDTFLTNERPIQGPFTNAHVGGHQSRHIDINRFDSNKTSRNQIDSYETRPEAWKILLGIEYGTDTTMMGIVGPDYPYPTGPYPFTDFKMATRYRNVGAKRPINIRNINYTTASTVMGNYSHNYEIVQTAGRSVNNRFFTRMGGIPLPHTDFNSIDYNKHFPATTTLSTLLGLKHAYGNPGNFFGSNVASDGTLELSNRYEIMASFLIPARTGSLKTKSIFVNRFSSPGGPEVNSLGYLDIAASEKSVYNALPFRNLSVRGSGSGEAGTIRANNLNRRAGLRTLLSQHAGHFGSALNADIPSETYQTIPSWHKVNRNPRNRIQFNAATTYSDNNYVTGTVYDNALITHPIPRSDYQYSWITASADEARGRAGLDRGLTPRGFYGHTFNDSEISSSIRGFHQAISFVSESDVSAVPDGSSLPNIHVDFVGLNTLVVEQISLDGNIASGSEKHFFDTANYRNEFFQSNRIQTGILTASMLNALTLHRNGAYGVNTWKQTRTGEHAVARKMKQSNVISYFRKVDNLEYPLKNDRTTPQPLRGASINFIEPPLQTKFNSVVQNLSIRATTPDNRQIIKDVEINTSYGNAISYFNNIELNNLLSDQMDRTSVPAYDRIRDLYTKDQINNPNSPVEKFNSLTYSERVYPSSINAFSSSIRVRQSYKNNFWRSVRSKRENSSVKSFSQTIPLQSMWDLDADTDWATREPDSRRDSTGGAGVLQNMYSQIHNGTPNKVIGAMQYARRHTINNVRSVIGPEGLELPATGAVYSSAAGYFGMSPKDIFGGQTLWEAGVQSNKEPWYNSYEDYVSEMRLKGKDYSIVPEFRISDHINLYVKENSGDFLVDNDKFLQMTGAIDTKNSSHETSFFKTYTNSDFLKYFGIIRDDLSDTGTPSSLTLTCAGLIKFLPYNDFYPSERVSTMAEQFSSSYGRYVNFDIGQSGIGANHAYKTFSTPLFAPGVLFNTIKSGIAVDYPVFTSSFNVHGIGKGGGTSYLSGTSGDNVGLFGYRVPFESLVEPESYITDVTLVDMETHASSAFNVTASWSGQGSNVYKMMANNFLAESINFFLPEGKLTTIASKPEDEWESAESGKVYAARVKMRKSYNSPTVRTGSLGYYNPLTPFTQWRTDYHETFTMYSRPSAFGPPVGGGITGTPLYGSTNGFNPCFTPPYYYGEAWADVFWTANKSGVITSQDITDSGNLAISYIRIGNDWALTNGKLVDSRNTLLHADNIEANSMQLDASLNLFSRAEVKKITFDAKTKEPILAEDGGTSVLTIQTKFETPMLNFAKTEATLPTFGSASIARGMWHQYGQIPNSPDDGVFLSITDIPDNYIENALGGNPATTGSLIDLLGFKTEEKRLGEISDTKVIREGIVAIPYIEKNGERDFFEIPKEEVDAALLGNESVSNSVKNMVELMQKFVIPPKLDFVKNPEAVAPFSMYIFEFEHTLDRDDLVDIWQGLPPKIGQSFDSNATDFKAGKGPHTSEIVKEVQISHPLVLGELLNNDNLPSRLRWMVFKVKQKAETNYFDKTIKDETENGAGFNKDDVTKVGRKGSSKTSIPDYSFNWPYDFFSLVELVKLNAEIEISKDPESKENS